MKVLRNIFFGVLIIGVAFAILWGKNLYQEYQDNVDTATKCFTIEAAAPSQIETARAAVDQNSKPTTSIIGCKVLVYVTKTSNGYQVNAVPQERDLTILPSLPEQKGEQSRYTFTMYNQARTTYLLIVYINNKGEFTKDPILIYCQVSNEAQNKSQIPDCSEGDSI